MIAPRRLAAALLCAATVGAALALVRPAPAAFAPAPHHAQGPAVCGRHQAIPRTGMLCVEVPGGTWTPRPGNYPLTFTQTNWRAGLIVVVGTFDAAGCTLAINGLPSIMPALLVEADSIVGTCTATTLPAGTQLVQTAGQIRLEYAP